MDTEQTGCCIDNRRLTRELFRELVFARNGHKCIFCGEPAVDAHHIIERRLFGDCQGYHIDNGASVCQDHHLECEKTIISVEDVRIACGIKKIIVPQHLYTDQQYDKWGNPIMTNGTRAKGELFDDESVQKILKEGGVLPLFTDYVKYPRTYHVPWSPGIHSDDKIHPNIELFDDQEVIATIKIDGECTSMYSDYIHARSINSGGHPSRNWVKAYHSQRCGDIPPRWRICGENVFATHSIHYDDLDTFFYGFSVWNDRNMCLSWDETLEWFQLLNITPVPLIYRGIYDRTRITEKYTQIAQQRETEGYCIRVAGGFHYKDFRKFAAKYVRANHIQTTKHWFMGQQVVPNKLKD